MESFTFIIRTGPFPVQRVVWLFLIIRRFIEIPVFNANSIDPDQTPHSAASDLGLHCFADVLFMRHLT